MGSARDPRLSKSLSSYDYPTVAPQDLRAFKDHSPAGTLGQPPVSVKLGLHGGEPAFPCECANPQDKDIDFFGGPGWPKTHCADQAGFKLRDLPPSVSRGLSVACTHSPRMQALTKHLCGIFAAGLPPYPNYRLSSVPQVSLLHSLPPLWGHLDYAVTINWASI